MLEGRDLECERGGRMLFRGLALAVAPGELLRVAGPNGSGKTSLLKILCGLLRPSAGDVHWQGKPIASLREEFSRQIVYLGHAPAVKDDLTAAENLYVSCKVAGVEASRQSITQALQRFAVPEASLVRKLSQGQRRRAALARLLLSSSAPLWLLDEPFTALDTAAAGLMRELITAHVARGAVVYTTHQDSGLRDTRTVEL